MAIPIVDMKNLDLGNSGKVSSGSLDQVSKELDAAFSSVGFVYLKNHGISQDVIRKCFATSAEFFALPIEEKRKFTRDTAKSLKSGYVPAGQEILENKSSHEIREAYDITSMDAGFNCKEHPEFWKSIHQILPELSKLSQRLLRCLALALGLEEDYFIQRHKFMCTSTNNNPTTFRTLFYPSLSADEIQQPGVQRCGEHSDYGTITLLFQDDMGGLEVLSDGQWIPATPIPGTVLVNLGDLMQFWTADRYKATVHRVRVPEEETRRRCSRQSLAFFVHPDNEVMVTPLDGSDKYPTVSALDHLNHRYSQTYTY